MRKLLLLLNVKPNEAGIVKKLFVIQFLLGIATAFLYTSSLTLFLSKYPIDVLPYVFIIAALLILVFNKLYAYFEHRYAATVLLQLIVVFTLVVTFVFWCLIQIFSEPVLVLLFAAWTTLLYMLVGYSFWGLASLLFNVRESRRLFSIVSAGDIPAKMLGYLAVSVLVQFTGVANLLWISIAALLACYFYIHSIREKIIVHQTEARHAPEDQKVDLSLPAILKRLFTTRLVLFISLTSFISFLIFSFVDFTFLLEIKTRYKKDFELASFIAIFFAIGRFFAIFMKLLLTSRLIGKMGLLNSLLLTPVLLFAINIFIISSGGFEDSRLYLFGSMVLLMEVLRSIIQEPVFFILFQPLTPHDRLRGHLIAKGYTFPLALLVVGSFLVVYLRYQSSISIFYTSTALLVLIIFWIITVFMVKREYMQTLISTLKRGFFTGADLFINNESVFAVLTKKLESRKPLEIINALNLLERSGYGDIKRLLLSHIEPSHTKTVREYALSRIIHNNISEGLYSITLLIANNDTLSPVLYKALFFLEPFEAGKCGEILRDLYNEAKKSALAGLLLKKDPDADQFVHEQLVTLTNTQQEDDLILVNEVLASADSKGFEQILQKLLDHSSPIVYRPAIETAGRLWAFELFPQLLQVVEKSGAWLSFQVALVNFGDEVFDGSYLKEDMSEKMLRQVIRSASRVKGSRSDEYLFRLFVQNINLHDAIIHALWQKKADARQRTALLEEWFSQKLEDMRLKVDCFLNLYNNKPALLLENALLSEIQQNVETLLKGFSILYERQQIDRFMEIYRLDNASKLANAIELLELTIPRKFFNQLIPFIELKHDIKKKQVIMQQKHTYGMAKLLDEVVESEHVFFNSWSRSIALYLTPKLLNKDSAMKVITRPVTNSDELFSETRDYVLSILKQN